MAITTGNFVARFLMVLYAIFAIHHVNACRVNSEKFKNYAKKSIERLLDVEQLESFYWSEEPLNEVILSKLSGLNVTLAETRFDLKEGEEPRNENSTAILKPVFLKEIFVSCSANRDRRYTLTLNLELDNPFKVIDLHFKQNDDNDKEVGLFRIRLPQSTLYVQLSQRINYDECLEVNYVQLAPNVHYKIECLDCTDKIGEHLDNVFNKKIKQLDSEIDSMVSEKLLLGLKTLITQQRLDLDLFTN